MLTREILAGSRSLFQFPLLSDSSLNVTITLLSRFFCFVFTKAFRSQYILVCYESPLSQSKSPYLIAVSGRKIWVRATACMSSCSPCLHIPSPACLPSTVSSLSPPFPSLPFSFLAVTSLFSGSIKKSREGENRVDRRGEKNYRRESKRGGKKGEKKSGGAKHAGRSSALHGAGPSSCELLVSQRTELCIALFGLHFATNSSYIQQNRWILPARLSGKRIRSL